MHRLDKLMAPDLRTLFLDEILELRPLKLDSFSFGSQMITKSSNMIKQNKQRLNDRFRESLFLDLCKIDA